MTPAVTGVPTWADHSTAPLVAESAYTVSFSVATKTRPSEGQRLAVELAVERR